MRSVLAVFSILIAAAAAITALFSAFIVNQYQQAIVLQFGEPLHVYSAPGLYWRIPFVQTVEYFDKRILDLEIDEQQVTAADQKRLIVDAFVRYRISDPLQFYKSFRNEDNAEKRLTAITDSTLRGVLGRVVLIDVVSNRREELMRQTAKQVFEDVRNLGIEIVDVRIKRADLPPANAQAIFARMKSERQQEAQDLRSQGSARAETIKANADREVVVIKATANGDAERIKGEGDAERNHIYANAYGRDPEFFAFYRSMQAYEQAFTGGNTRLLLSPDSEFFRYFSQIGGGAMPAAQVAKPGGQGGAPAR